LAKLILYMRGDGQACVARPGRQCRAEVVVADRVSPDEAEAVSKAIGLDGSDPRWPKACDHCGIEFDDEPKRTIGREEYYTRADTGEQLPMSELPAGATFHADWWAKAGGTPDGIHLTVRLPNGTDWMPDSPPSGGGSPWSRMGDPRQANVTCSPSIASGKAGQPGYYHGWLRNGELVEC